MTPTRKTARAPTVFGCCALLAVVVAVAWPAVAMFAGRSVDSPTWLTTAVAAFVCWFSASLSLIVAHHYRLHGSAMVGTFAGMFIRMAIPMAVGVAVTAHGGFLAREDLFGQLVVFFLLTLAVETWLSVALARATISSTGTTAKKVSPLTTSSAPLASAPAGETAGGPHHA
jgi:hypothetical protein